MKIKLVPRSKVHQTKKRTSKFQPLINALGELNDGDAIEVKYSNEKELLSMRNTVYLYQKRNGLKIVTKKDESSGKFYIWRDK